MGIFRSLSPASVLHSFWNMWGLSSSKFASAKFESHFLVYECHGEADEPLPKYRVANPSNSISSNLCGAGAKCSKALLC